MFKITGLDQLTKQLSDAQKTVAALEGDLGTVRFNPDNPASIEAAIQSVNATIDARVGSYDTNPLVAPLIDAAKETFRKRIIGKAAAARLNAKEIS